MNYNRLLESICKEIRHAPHWYNTENYIEIVEEEFKKERERK